MSRTFRNITPSGKLNQYSSYEFRSFCNRSYRRNDSNLECLDYFLKQYHRVGTEWRVPREYRNRLNRSKRRQDAQILYNHLKYDSFDNMLTFKWFKNASYNYW